MPNKKDEVLLIESKTVYDLNWVYCRRAILKFKAGLLSYPLSLYSFIKNKGVV